MNTKEADADVYLELHRIMSEESKDKNPKPMKYIPADKLIAEIERQNVDKKVIEPLIRIITSLQQEQPEVDLEKALDGYYKNADFGPSEAIEYEIHKDIARHFYELARQKYEK